MSYYQSSDRSSRGYGGPVNAPRTSMEMSVRMTTSISLLAATLTLFLFQRDPENNNNANRLYQFCKTKILHQYNNMNMNNVFNKYWNNNNNTTDTDDNNNKNNGSDGDPTAILGSGDDENDTSTTTNTSGSSKGGPRRYYPQSRQKLDLEMAKAAEIENEKDKEENENRNRIVRHKGSCHCSAVAFHITAPKSLQVEEGTGKIPFPRTLIKAKYFTLRQGAEALQTYYDDGTSTQAAHTFCGQCGVHLLYAPSPQSSYLYLNVDCLRPGSWKYIRMMNTVQEDCDDEEIDDGQNDIEEGTSSNNEKENHQHQHHHGDEFDKEEFKQYYTGKKTAGGCDISNIINSNNYHHQFTSPTIMAEVLGASSPNINNSGRKPLPDRPPIEITPRSNNKQQLQQRMESALFSAAAIARENYQSPSATTTRTRFVPPHQQHQHYHRTPSPVTAVDTEVDNDDISEPTIPPDLISTDEGESTTIADYFADDGSSVRSHFTESTARSLRFYMSKHMNNNNNNNQGEETTSGII